MDSTTPEKHASMGMLGLANADIAVVKRFSPARITSLRGQDEIFREIFAESGLIYPEGEQSDLRKSAASLSVAMIQVMDDRFDAARHSFKEGGNLQSDSQLLSKLMSVPTNFTPEGITVGELLELIVRVSDNKNLYPDEATRLIQNDIVYLQSTVLATIARVESNPVSATFEDALELRRITNTGEAALMFDLAYGNLINEPGYNQARKKVMDMAFATSLLDDFSDFTSDLEEGGVNSFLACANNTGELTAIKNIFRTKGYKRQAKRGEVTLSDNSIAFKYAPKACNIFFDTQSKVADAVGSEQFSKFNSLRNIFELPQ